MKFTFTLLGLIVPLAQAQLVITEAMADSSHSSTAINGDWWELTNVGPTEVDLSGYTWDDLPETVPSVSHFPDVSIAAGETIVILAENFDKRAAWKSAWGLGLTDVQVLTKDQFIKVDEANDESFSNLSSSGDEVNLYDPDGSRVAHVEFGPSITGKSKAYLRDGSPIYDLDSSNGKHGAVNSNQGPADTASPGDAKLHFVTAPVIYGTTSYSYSIAAELTGSSAPTFTATSLPSFLSLSPGDPGMAVLSSNRPLSLDDAGNYLVQVTANSGGTSTIQEFLITVLNDSPTLILNEYNAVSSSNFLNGGDEATDEDGGEASEDSYFGRIAGNGGQWVEFVVVGDGAGGETDLRNWSIEIGKNEGSGFTVKNTLMLSDHANWQTVPNGTILTLIEKNSSQGGLDTGFALRDQRETTGDTWTNVWIGDPSYFEYSSPQDNGYNLTAGVVTGIDIDNSGTQFRLKDPSGRIIFGPVGEGVAPLSGTSSKEVFELENHPTPAISPIVATTDAGQGYDDGASDSTFGSPNHWLEGEIPSTQDYSPYAVSAFDLWAGGKGLSGTEAEETADPDQDGRDNLSEYAFGGDPTRQDAAYPSGMLLVGSQIEWSYVRRANDPSLTYSYESSETLSTWLPIEASSSTNESYAGDSEFETLNLQFTKPDPMPARWFLRAKVQ